MYSNSAMPQLINITVNKGRLCAHFISLNFRCPYQAKVMKALERMSKRIVNQAFIG
jgi:hypothetical protein